MHTVADYTLDRRQLSAAEKQGYISAVKCLRNLPSTKYNEPHVTTRHDDFVWTHLKLNLEIHAVVGILIFVQLFFLLKFALQGLVSPLVFSLLLPRDRSTEVLYRHRMFLQEYETALRSECGYTGFQPYWDWTIDANANNVVNSPIWDPVTGFGGNGQLTGNTTTGFQHCVTDGPFAGSVLTVGQTYPNFFAAGNIPHCLTRQFSGQMQANLVGYSISLAGA
jgi:tyrosinase